MTGAVKTVMDALGADLAETAKMKLDEIAKGLKVTVAVKS